MCNKFNIFFFLLLTLMSCREHKKDSVSKGKKEQISSLSKTILNNDFKVKIKLERDKLTFEIISNNNYKIIQAINEFGEISFTSSSPIIGYNGDSILILDNLFLKNGFLLFPVEDWNGNRIFYKVPLKESDYKETIRPFFIMKEQYCIFNQRSETLLTYERLKKEFIIENESYCLTVLNLYHLVGENNEGENSLKFWTQKEIDLLENDSPIEVRNKLINAVSVFYDKKILESYFK